VLLEVKGGTLIAGGRQPRLHHEPLCGTRRLLERAYRVAADAIGIDRLARSKRSSSF
jgi:hypothetical protein